MNIAFDMAGLRCAWAATRSMVRNKGLQICTALTLLAPSSMPAQGAELQPSAEAASTSKTPRINGPALFGVRPGKPLLYRVPVSGLRPIRYRARGLPPGARIDSATGLISGRVGVRGTYRVTLIALNRLGRAQRPFRLVVGDEIGLTPPMGWNSWNVWGSDVTQDHILSAAKAMVASGLADHGWTYVNIDDAWQGKRGGPLMALQPDPTRFPDMKRLADQVHGMGLKIGIYHSPWVRTYAGRLGGSAENPLGAAQAWPGENPRNKKILPHAVGRYRFTANDARQFADWGIDYLKYDWGPVEYPEAKEMHDALRAQDRDIFYSLSNNAARNLFADIGRVSTVANAWRTTTDITDSWSRMAGHIGFEQNAWAPFARPGHYNDADMLVVGVLGWGVAKQHPTKLTPEEQYTHLSLWALLASPLLLGADLEKLDPFTLSLLRNDEVIAVNQDPMVRQAVRVAKEGETEVYARRLEDGSLAVGLFNRGSEPTRVAASWSGLGIAGSRKVRDLWRQRALGFYKEGYSAIVAPHGALLLKVSHD